MKKCLLFLLLSIVISNTSFSQIDSLPKSHVFYADLFMGPYLLIDHTLYKSVVMKGTRLGFETKKNFAFDIEYAVGQQHDETDVRGTTHSAMGRFSYFITNRHTKFRPFVNTGGGFFEFKDFSKDRYGVAFFLSGGSELNISPRVKSFFEGRYLNIGQLNLAGTHELGVFWGIKAKF